MRIALINENSQAAKNELILNQLKRSSSPWAMWWTTTACTPRRMTPS